MQNVDFLENMCYGNHDLDEMLRVYCNDFLKPERSMVFLGHERNYAALENTGACFRNFFSEIFIGIKVPDAKDYYEGIAGLQEQYLYEYVRKVANKGCPYNLDDIDIVVKHGRDCLPGKSRVAEYSDIINKIDPRKFMAVADVTWTCCCGVTKENLFERLKDHMCHYLCTYDLMVTVLQRVFNADYDHEAGHQHTIEFHKFLAHYAMSVWRRDNDTNIDDVAEYAFRSMWLGVLHLERAVMDIYKNIATILAKNNLLPSKQMEELLVARQNEFNNKSGTVANKAVGYYKFFKSTGYYGECLIDKNLQTRCVNCFNFNQN